MLGQYSGFISLRLADDDYLDFMSYNCIIHQQTLCAKVLKMDDIMNTALKIANSIEQEVYKGDIFKYK